MHSKVWCLQKLKKSKLFVSRELSNKQNVQIIIYMTILEFRLGRKNSFYKYFFFFFFSAFTVSTVSAFGGKVRESIEVEKISKLDGCRRRSFLASIACNVIVSPCNALSNTIHVDKFPDVDWTIPKVKGLNSERMADAINDSLREKEWVVTGRGQPEFFSDSFIYRDEMGSEIYGYETYCNQMRKKYLKGKILPKCELICCSVTGENTISALWRLGFLDKDGKSVAPKNDKVTLSVFSTSEEYDGLVVHLVDKIVTQKNAPSVEVLRSKCDWYTCNLRG